MNCFFEQFFFACWMSRPGREGLLRVGENPIYSRADSRQSTRWFGPKADLRKLMKSTMVRVGDVRTFENFIVDVPPGIDPSNFTSVIVWCESFGQFITSAEYR